MILLHSLKSCEFESAEENTNEPNEIEGPYENQNCFIPIQSSWDINPNVNPLKPFNYWH